MRKLAVDLATDRYDNSTYYGRFRNMMVITSPTTLLTTESQLEDAKRLVKTHMDDEHHEATEEQLWRAKQLIDSCIHPDTGETVFPLLRMSAFMPTNILLCWGLLLPQTTIAATLGWQWLNQSYNLAVNYANANKTNELNFRQIGGAYGAAVVASCAIAVGLGSLVRRGKVPRFLSPIVPYCAVAGAGMLNVTVMRWNEIEEGITVRDVTGENRGKSQIAGRKAVELSAVSRAVWSIPALAIPPATMALLNRSKAFRSNPRIHTPVLLSTIAFSLFFGVPAAVGIFPREMQVRSDELESEFQNLVDVHGDPVKTLYYSKGL